MWNSSENQVTLVFIRHGQTQANKERRYLGKKDESLLESGKEVLLSYKEQNIYPTVEYLFTSPMKRCVETANILYPELCPVVIPEWEEMDFGRFENKNYEELKDDIQYQAWLESGGVLDFPEGESREKFILRCNRGFMRICDVVRQDIESDRSKSVWVGMIVHGGTIMALLSLYGEKQYFDYQVLNGRGYICSLTGWGNSMQIKEITRI